MQTVRNRFITGVMLLTRVFLLCVGFYFFTPDVLFAQDYGLGETAGKAGLPNTDQDVFGLVGIVIGAVLGLVGVIFFVLMVYAGFLWMTSGGSPDRAGKAKTLLVQSVVGVVIIVTAWAITNFVIGALQGV